jgi:hypothetical protein
VVGYAASSALGALDVNTLLDVASESHSGWHGQQSLAPRGAGWPSAVASDWRGRGRVRGVHACDHDTAASLLVLVRGVRAHDLAGSP